MARKKKEVEEPVVVEQPHVDGLPPEALDMQRMLRENRNKYLLINLVAQRAYDLKSGARSQVDTHLPHTNIELAIAESWAGLLKVHRKQVETKVVNLLENN